MDMKRRPSRQMFLEEQFKIKVLEIGRRHTVLNRRNSRRNSVLPPIADAKLTNVKRERAKSIAMVSLPYNEESYGTIINAKLPVKLPNINTGRKMSLQDNESHWNLPNRRLSKMNHQLVVDHLRINLLRQHEKRSHDYEEEIKAFETESESDFSVESNDEDTIKWLQAVRSRGPSLSMLNFHSPLATTPFKPENVFENSIDSMRSFPSVSQSPTPSVETAKKQVQPIKFGDSQRFAASFSSARPSICVSFAPSSPYDEISEEDADEIEKQNKKNEVEKPTASSSRPSQLHRSLSESERSVSLLIQHAKRRSGLFEIPESDREPRTSIDPQSLSPSSQPRSQNRLRSGRKIEHKDDVYSDLPIDKVSLFGDWKMQTELSERGACNSICLDVDEDCRFPRSALSSRGSYNSPESRPVTATRELSCEENDMDCCDSDEMVSDNRLEFHDTNTEQRKADLKLICLGNVNKTTWKLRRKVCLYMSSNGDDTDLERGILTESVIPELRHYCGERNLDLSVIDIGYLPRELRPPHTSSKQSWFKFDDRIATIKLKRKVIKECFAESIGPCFLSFFGDCIDSIFSLPRRIPQHIFEGMIKLIEEEIDSTQTKMQIAQIPSLPLSNSTSNDSKTKRAERRSFAMRRSSIAVSETSKNQEKLLKLQQEEAKLKEEQLLLSSWYLLNTNICPSCYQLRNTSSEFATFSVSRRAIATNDEKRKDEERWLIIEEKLRNILIKYTDPQIWKEADRENASVADWRKQAFISDIEAETYFVTTLPAWKMRELCFWFHRSIADANYHSNQIHSFVSSTNASQTLNAAIKNKFGYSNVRERVVSWSALEQPYTSRDVDQVRNRDWLMYIDRLKTDFSSVCKTMIDKAVTKYQLQNENALEEEVHQHVAFAQDLAKNFCGRKELLNILKIYLRSKKQRQPFVIFGPCGCGKSSVLSQAAFRANSWMEKKSRKIKSGNQNTNNCRIIFRSIGLTGESSNFRLFLSGICAQLLLISDSIEEEESSGSEENNSPEVSATSKKVSFSDLNFKQLVSRFHLLMKKCGRRKMPLLIFIDNLDAISSDSDAKLFKWIPSALPRFVKLVVTISAEDSGRVEDKIRKLRPLSRTESLQKIKTLKSNTNRFKISKTQSSECLTAIQQRFNLEKTNLLRIPCLETNLAANVSALKVQSSSFLQVLVTRKLQREKISLSAIQIDTIVNSCRYYPHPLAIDLCVRILLSQDWTSQTTLHQCQDDLPQRSDSMDAFVNCFFRHLESNHGRPFVAAVCSYITTSMNGLTSNELLTLLSYDKNISKWLTDLSIKYKPGDKENKKSSAKKTISKRDSSSYSKKTAMQTNSKATRRENYAKRSFPQLLWERLKNDLNYFLMETLSDRKLTFRWRHVIFGSVSIKRYLSTKEAQSPYHQLMAYYFNNQIPTISPEDLCQPLYWKRNNQVYSAQEIVSSSRSEEKLMPSGTVFNFRRINESFHHYFACRSLDEIKEDLLCNFEWMIAKMKASGFQSITNVLSSVLALHSGEKDLRLLAETLYLSRDILTDDPTQLGGQLVGRLYDIIKKDKPLARLDPRKYPYCKKLIGQCRRSSLPALIPSGTCLSSPGDVLYDLLLGHSAVITALTMTTDGHRVITASKDETIKVWDLFSGCVVSTLEKMPRHVVSLSMCLGNNHVCVLDNTNKIQVISLLQSTCLLSLADLEGRIAATVSGESSCFLVVFFDQIKEMKVWDLNTVRLLYKIDIAPDGCILREDQHLITGKTSGGNTVFFSFHSTDQAYVYNVKRAKHLHTLKLHHDNGRGIITHVETSREYYVIACKRRYMRLHERVTFELYDSINFGHVRTLKACPEDKVFDICINRLGSHLIGLCHVDSGTAITAWNVESGYHQHLDSEKFRSTQGCCMDLQYCITMNNETLTLRVHNLAARIDNKTMSRTHIKKKSSGIGEFYPVTSNSRYVVARGIDSGPITVWNITRGRCTGEAVSIERGLLEKNDVIVVKDVMVIVLSDRGITSAEEGSYQIFTTIYVYDLQTKKYTRKLKSVAVTVCPRHEYRILGLDKLLAVSPDRSHFLIWSLIDGQVLNSIEPDFSKYIVSEVAAKESREKKWKRGRALAKDKRRTRKTISLMTLTDLAKKPTSAKFRLTTSEQNKLIDQMLLSGDEGTLLCSFYGRHVAVFDMKNFVHKHTLTNKHSMLLLHQAEVTYSGSHLVHTNYDNDAKVSYITVWSLQHGKLVRRLRNEPYVCALTTSDEAAKVVFATEDNYLKIWEPFKKGGHCAIPGYKGLRMRKRSNDCQGTTVYLTSSADRAILFSYDISLWDLVNVCVLARFTPDVPFQCCTVAMNGNLIVAGIKEQENVVTLRLLSRDLDVTQYGRATLGENLGEFGEAKEKDSESSEDEVLTE